MLINLSSHPSQKWSVEQTAAAAQFGEIVDLPFPLVDANGDESYINALAEEYSHKVQALAHGERVTVHLMGEMTLTFAILHRLQELGIRCIAATSERIVKEIDNEKKEVLFHFCRFRKYEDTAK